MKSSMLTPLNSLLFAIVVMCDVFQTIYPTGLTLKMIHRDSLESPLYRPNLAEDEQIQISIHTSKLRYESISAATNNHHPQNAVCSLIHTQDVIYMVQLGIGQFGGSTPYLTYYLLLDTGSGHTWTQCEGCRTCFRQRDPYFPKSRSRTYNPFPCNECPPNTRCQQDHCSLSLSFADKSFVNGILARETFTFDSNKTFQNLTFLCGIEMHVPALDRHHNNIISGDIGLGYGANSFASQLKTRGLGTFSYCLHPLSTPPHQTPMFLRFGNDIPRVRGMVSTPLRAVVNFPFYYVNLLHISVANIRLNLPNGILALKSDYTGGVILDSGSALTHLISEAYEVLQNSIGTYIRSNNRNLQRMPTRQGSYEDCWGGSSDPSQVNLPSVTFHFENADMVLQPSSVFYLGELRYPYVRFHTYCLAMVRATIDNGVSVIGAYQQGNQRLIYDLDRNQLTFMAADCSQQSN